MSDVFTKQHLLLKIKEANKSMPEDKKIGSSYNSLVKYEKRGIIPLPKSMIGRDGARNWRLYSREEIDQIISKLKVYKLGK